MAEHDIDMKFHSKIVENKDVEFDVYSDGPKLGCLKVSKGTIEWVPNSHRSGFHMEWEAFDEMMRDNGKKK